MTLPSAQLPLIVRQIMKKFSFYREVDCSNILDTSAQLPLLALQIMKLSPRAKLTLSVDTGTVPGGAMGSEGANFFSSLKE